MTDEQRKRIHDITYSTEDRMELAERIVALEEERDHWRVEQVHAYSNWEDAHKRAFELEEENAKLRELVYDMLQDEEREHNDELTFNEHVERANELGVEI